MTNHKKIPKMKPPIPFLFPPCLNNSHHTQKKLNTNRSENWTQKEIRSENNSKIRKKGKTNINVEMEEKGGPGNCWHLRRERERKRESESLSLFSPSPKTLSSLSLSPSLSKLFSFSFYFFLFQFSLTIFSLSLSLSTLLFCLLP